MATQAAPIAQAAPAPVPATPAAAPAASAQAVAPTATVPPTPQPPTPLGVGAAPTQMTSAAATPVAAAPAVLAPSHELAKPKRTLFIRILSTSVHIIFLPFKWIFNCIRGKSAQQAPVSTGPQLLTRLTARNQCQEVVDKLHGIRVSLRNVLVALPTDYPRIQHRFNRVPFAPIPFSLHLDDSSAMSQLSGMNLQPSSTGAPAVPANRYFATVSSNIITNEIRTTHQYIYQLQEMISDTPRALPVQSHNQIIAPPGTPESNTINSTERALSDHMHVMGQIHFIKLAIPHFWADLHRVYNLPSPPAQLLQMPPSYSPTHSPTTPLTEDRARALHQEEIAQLNSIEQLINTLNTNFRQLLQQTQIPAQPAIQVVAQPAQPTHE